MNALRIFLLRVLLSPLGNVSFSTPLPVQAQVSDGCAPRRLDLIRRDLVFLRSWSANWNPVTGRTEQRLMGPEGIPPQVWVDSPHDFVPSHPRFVIHLPFCDPLLGQPNAYRIVVRHS